VATQTTERQGYFTGWTLKREGIIAPDERLPWGQTIFLGLQHVLAMFGSTVLAPIIMGFNPNTAIFFSGIGTLIFFLDEVTAQIARLLGVPLPQKPPFSSDPAWGMRHGVDSCLKVV
jgi:Permease family